MKLWEDQEPGGAVGTSGSCVFTFASWRLANPKTLQCGGKWLLPPVLILPEAAEAPASASVGKRLLKAGFVCL